MAYEFKRLADVELLDKVPEGCSVLAEVDGVERRLPGEGLGSSSNALILVGTTASSGGEEMSLMNISTLSSSAPTFESIVANMTLQEALAAFDAGEISMAAVYIIQDGEAGMMPGFVVDGRNFFGIECLGIYVPAASISFYWTVDGISTDAPVGEK